MEFKAHGLWGAKQLYIQSKEVNGKCGNISDCAFNYVGHQGTLGSGRKHQ